MMFLPVNIACHLDHSGPVAVRTGREPGVLSACVKGCSDRYVTVKSNIESFLLNGEYKHFPGQGVTHVSVASFGGPSFSPTRSSF